MNMKFYYQRNHIRGLCGGEEKRKKVVSERAKGEIVIVGVEYISGPLIMHTASSIVKVA